jgi:ATP-dependent Clp protease ATP-binding subunit ClpB
VVLFDEIEKAHPDIWNTLLQVLDDGRLTDGQGHTVDFKNTIIILTSNLGTPAATAIEDRDNIDAADKAELIRRAVMDEVRKHFRPEFLNRLDDTLIFRRLSRSEMEKIVDIQLRHFEGRLARRGIGLVVTDGAKGLLMERGWDPQYGARPLKRAIQRYVEDELAKKILAGELAQGDTVQIGRSGSDLTFGKVQLN